MKIYWLAPILFFASVSAHAADAKPAAKSAADAAAADSNRRVCFAEPVTGSHVKRRVCMTEAEREARRIADQEALTKLHTGKTGKGKGDRPSL